MTEVLAIDQFVVLTDKVVRPNLCHLCPRSVDSGGVFWYYRILLLHYLSSILLTIYYRFAIDMITCVIIQVTTHDRDVNIWGIWIGWNVMRNKEGQHHIDILKGEIFISIIWLYSEERKWQYPMTIERLILHPLDFSVSSLAVFRRRYILLLPSSGTHLWSDYGNLLHVQRFLNRVLARGKIGKHHLFYFWCSIFLQLVTWLPLTWLSYCINFQDVRFLLEDIQELKPTIFCGVPRVYDRIYSG